MSGRKCSNYSLDRAREIEANLANQVSAQLGDLRAVVGSVNSLSGGRPASIRTHHAELLSRLADWNAQALSGIESASRLRLGVGSSSLQSALGRLASLVSTGRQLRDELVEVVEASRRAVADRTRRLRETESELAAREAFLAQWLGAAAAEPIRLEIHRARTAMSAEDLESTDEALRSGSRRLAELDKTAARREEEHVQQEQARELAAGLRTGEGRHQALSRMIESASEGLRRTFDDDVREVRGWLGEWRGHHARLTALGPASPIDDLRRGLDLVKTTLQRGEGAESNLRAALEKQAPELRRRGEQRIQAVAEALESATELLGLWEPADQLEAFRRQLRDLEARLVADKLLEIDQPATRLEAEIGERLSRAAGLEDRHRRRLYLLKALRQVCADMGFGEIESPRLENESDRGSRVRLGIDTYNQGIVTFFLSLDSVEADSCISESFCLDDFNKLSTRIAEQFGVQTSFRMADGSPPPRLIRKGELDEPTGQTRSQDQ